MEEHKYRFERINESHYADMCMISRSAFNIDPGISFYKNKNRTEKFGENNLGYIAYSEDGEPAAFYGVYAHLVEFNGTIYKAVQSGDTMTHKKHMGKGLFTKLAKMTYVLAKEKGAEFVFGSPNYNSFPGFVKKLNWVCPEKFNDYRIPTLAIPLAKIAKKVKLFDYLYKPYLNFLLKKYKSPENDFRNSISGKDVAAVYRNQDFYDYKSASGCRILSIDGINIWVKVDGFLFIGDIDLTKEFDFNKFIRKFKIFCFLIGSTEAVFITSPGTKLDALFSTSFKSKEGFPVGGAPFTSAIPIEKFKMVLGDLDTF